MAESDSSWFLEKLIKPVELDCVVRALRASHLTIATLNGSFDLMHAGHLHILHEASKQADRLIVALNSDASVRSYKDPNRPIIPLSYRLEMMAAIQFVDFVTWFDEDDPCVLLKRIRPDVHVNGEEYLESCIEAEVVKECGGKLHFVSRIPSLSTSNIIEKILNLPRSKCV